MSFNEFLNKVESVEKLVSASELLRNESKRLKNECNIKSQKDFSDEYNDIVRENRLLRIGILGRVKAGKSSFLNALLFGGEDILPKAATPMTAALSIIEYGEENGFSVDFYSKADLADIESKAKQYESMLKESIEKKIATLKENARQKGESPKAEDLEKAESTAKWQLKQNNERLCACYEQNELIKKSKISLGELEAHKDFSGDLGAIRAKLNDYVGSEGKFMPFTKSITLRLNDEFLQNVQIVDTPGLNDPVPSRSARTLEFLDKCDAALVLSRAGQFLAQSEVELLDRLANLGSTARIFFVASKADEALSGDEYKGEFSKAFDKLEISLSTHLANTLKSQGFNGDKWANRIDNKIILSSSVRCVDMSMLQEQFGGDFAGANQNANLAKLSNMERLESIFAELKKQKEAILAQRRDKHLETITKNLQSYADSLIERIQEEVKTLNQKDIESVKKEAEILAKAKEKGEFILNDKWEQLSLDFKIKLKNELQSKKDEFFAKLKETSDSAKDKGVDKWETGMLWWKKEHTESYNIIDATAVRSGIVKTCRNVEELLTREIKDKIKQWRFEIQSDLLSALRGNVSDEFLDDVAFGKATKNAIAMISYPPIQYTTQIPDTIKGANGKLKRYEADKIIENYEADEFIKNVSTFCVDFENKVAEDIGSFIDTLERTLNAAKLGDEIFSRLDSELKLLQDGLLNKTLRLEEYKNLQIKLEEVMK